MRISVHSPAGSSPLMSTRFLLARLHLDSLKDKRSTKAVKNALVQLPSGSSAYDMAYQEAMERITPNQKETWT